MDKRKLIPSMFHRRLLLLFGGLSIVVMLMGLQLVRLTIVEGDRRLEEAEARLSFETYLPTYRGRIIDRKGRVLAQDRASYDVAVKFSVITGAWERRQALAQARRTIGSGRWSELSPRAKAEAIEACLPPWEAQTSELWASIRRIGGIDDAELQRRLDGIRREIQRTRAAVQERQLQRALAEFGDDIASRFRPQPIREEREAHVVLPRVSGEVAFAFRTMTKRLPGMVVVQDSRRRENPWASAEVRLDRTSLPDPARDEEPAIIRVDGVADHILGSVRETVFEEDMQRRPFHPPDGAPVDLAGYLPGDRVGSSGLEHVWERHLRGLRGLIRERRDTGQQRRVDPVPGQDLHLTLDIQLQARVQAILSPALGLTRVHQWHAGWHSDGTPKAPNLALGTPLPGAAVVLEVDSGEILAAVSMPTLAIGTQVTAPSVFVDQAHLHRAFREVYPPGSIIKPLVLAAAVSAHAHRLNEPIECTGHYFPTQKNVARCWVYREQYGYQNHGSLAAEEALARSCNIYFYTLSARLGMERLSNWYGRFGMGRHLDSGLLLLDETGAVLYPGESAGAIPTAEEISRLRRTGELKFATIIMGIGQGPVTWTPVQAANAYATLARGGVVRDATLLREAARHRGSLGDAGQTIDANAVSVALEGLRQSVEESHGTGHHIRYADGRIEPIINAEHVTVWAKTGTAQAPPLRRDLNEDGDFDDTDEQVRGLDHAWYVGLVGPRGGSPAYAIAVIVEYGGSGGRVAGPVANQIIRGLQAEGYLATGGGEW